MSLSDWADVSTIAQAILVTLSLFVIFYQLREGAKLARAANVQALTEQAATFNAFLYENEDLSNIWYSYGQNLESNIKRQRYREMIVQWLIFHQNIHYQLSKGLLDKEVYEPWLNDLESTIRKHNVDVASPDLQAFFPGAFGQHLTNLKRLASNKAA